MVLEGKNLSSLSLRKVVDVDGKKIGRIRDAVVNRENLEFRGFVIHGSKWEEMLEGLSIIQDVDPLVTPDFIAGINKTTITLKIAKDDLLNAKAPGTLAKNEIFLSDLARIPLKDKSGQKIGILTDIFFGKEGNPSYQIGGRDFFIYLDRYFFSRDLNYVIDPARLKFIEDHYQLQESLENIQRDLKLNMTNIVRDLMLEAMSDGKITDDEKDLVDFITIDLQLYYEALEKALEDNLITEKELKELDTLKEETVKKLLYLAQEDEVITRDERALIKKFAAYIVDRRKELFWKIYGTT